MGENHEEAKELWDEALEEDSSPAFELKTYDQFIEFIKVGIASLLEHKKLDKVENITDKHKDLIADIGLFVSLYGSYKKWKTERKQLKGRLSQSLNQLKKVTVENKSLCNMKDELEKKCKEYELQSVEIDVRKSEFEKSNIQLQSEVDKLIVRIAILNKKILDLSQFENGNADKVTADQLSNLRNTKIDYELKLSEKQNEIDQLLKEINAVDLQRQRMDEILVEYRTHLRKINEFKLDFDQVKSVYNNLDKKRLLLIESKKSEEEMLEKLNSEIDIKKHEESKVQDELSKFDIKIEKININKIENQNIFEDKQAEIENGKAKIEEIFLKKGDIDVEVQDLRKIAKDAEWALNQKHNQLQLKISEATNLQVKIEDNLTNSDQVAALEQTLQDVRAQIENLKEAINISEHEKQEIDTRLSDLTKNHNVFETQVSEIRRKIENTTSSLLAMQNEVRKSESRIDMIEIEKKTVIAQNQDILDELEKHLTRKEQIEKKIADLDAEIVDVTKTIEVESNRINQSIVEKNVIVERKFEFENRIIGLEGLKPRAIEKPPEKTEPLPFGAAWSDETHYDPDLASIGKKDQFLNYQKLSNLRLELSDILPRKIELKFRIEEIEIALERIEVEYSKSVDEKNKFDAESEQKNTAFEVEINNNKSRIKELTEEITSSNMKKIELMEEKEKLYASFKSQPKQEQIESDNVKTDEIAETEIMNIKRSQISEIEKEIFDLGEKINKCEVEKTILRDKNEIKVQERDAYNAKFDYIVRQCEKLHERKIDLEEELKSKRPMLNEISSECNKIEMTITETSAEYFAQTSEYVRLIHPLQNQNEEVSQINSDIEAHEKELRELTLEKENIREIKKQAIDQEETLTDEMRNMKIRIEVTEDEVLETKRLLEEAEEKVEFNDNILKDLWQKIHKIERIIEQKKERKKRILSSRVDLEKHVNAIEALMLTKENLMKSIRDELANAENSIESLTTEKTVATVQYENSLQQRKYVETINEELQDKIKQIKDKYDELYDEYTNSDSQVKDLKVKYPILEKELEKSKNTEKEALTKLIRFEEQYTRKTDKTKALSLMKDALNKEIAQFKQELDNVNLEKGNLYAEFEQVNIQLQKQSLTINELRDKLTRFQGLEKKFEALKKRNDYLEAEMKKFSSLLGFEDIDITTELKQRLINNATMNLSARFLQKGWDYKKTFLQPEDVLIENNISDSLNILSKPFDAMKLRLNLRRFFEGIKKEIPEKLKTYRVFFEKRTDEKPLNNSELKEVCSIESYFVTIEEILGELKHNLKISVPN